jgi:hypothetical protein
MKAFTKVSALLPEQQGLVIKLCVYIALLSTTSFAQPLIDSNAVLQHACHYTNSIDRANFIHYAKSHPISKTIEPAYTFADYPKISSCANIGFEDGDTKGWIINGDHQITHSGVDTFGNFPKVFPNGNHSLQLNNNNIFGKSDFTAKASRLITVTPNNTSLTIHFAMVLLEYPHGAAQAAKFKVRLKDANMQTLQCPNFNCYYDMNTGATGVDSFKQSSIQGLNTVYQKFPVSYVPWQSVQLDLTAYSGQTLALEIGGLGLLLY